MNEKKRYHLLLRFAILVIAMIILSEVETHTSLQGNQLFADISLLAVLALVFGLKAR